jgi:hypothetical protein
MVDEPALILQQQLSGLETFRCAGGGDQGLLTVEPQFGDPVERSGRAARGRQHVTDGTGERMVLYVAPNAERRCHRTHQRAVLFLPVAVEFVDRHVSAPDDAEYKFDHGESVTTSRDAQAQEGVLTQVTDDTDPLAPEDDPDFISTDGPSVPMFGVAAFSPAGLPGAPDPVHRPTKSTRLEEDDPDGIIPHAALWSMKYHRHLHLFDRTEVRIRAAFGDGDQAVYLIDDGRTHCVVSRMVGASPDGCTYCLVAQITIDAYERLANGEEAVGPVFAEARDFAMCAVFEAQVEDAPSNVTVVEQYADVDAVPAEYLSPSPFMAFADDPDTDN